MQNPFEVLERRIARQEDMLSKIFEFLTTQSEEPSAKQGVIDKSKIATRETAAEYLGLSVRSVDNLVASKQIKSTRIGKSVRFRWQDLDEFLEKRSK